MACLTRSDGSLRSAVEALAALAQLSKFLEASLASLAASSSSISIISNASSAPSDELPTAQKPTILSDLSGLYTLLSKETTALSLAFAPPSESWDAVHATCQRLQELAGKLVYCISMLRNSSRGESLLAKEYRHGSLTVLESLLELIGTCRAIYALLPDGKKITPEQRKRMLTLTSQVWKSIERTSQLPQTEQEAFSKAWQGMLEMLQDGLDEVEDLTHRPVLDKGKARAVEPAPDSTNGSEDDEADFDDLSEDDDEAPLEYAEAKVIRAAFQLMKLVKAMFRSIKAEHAGFESQGGEYAYQSVHAAGQVLLSAQDDLASVLDPPLRLIEVGKLALSYRNAAKALCDITCEALTPADVMGDLTSGMDRLGTQAKASTGSYSAERWLLNCRQNIERAADELEESCSIPGR